MATPRSSGYVRSLPFFCGSLWLLKDNRAFFLDIGCVRGPQDHPQVWFARRTHRTQYLVIRLRFIPEKDYKATSAQRNGAWWGVWRKPGTSFWVPPVQSHRMYLIPPATSCDSTCETSTGKLIRASAPRAFTADWSRQHPPLNMYQNPRFPKERRCSLQTILFVTFWHSEPLVPGWWGPAPNPSSQLPAKG